MLLKVIVFGIVGSRECSRYGVECTKYFSSELAKRKINIISGLARGIDTITHNSCIQAGGKTVAVLGNGLDRIYPEENTKLAEQIVSTGGTIITEFAPGEDPSKVNFPRRNRIISGLSDSIIVTEAKLKSGALITADFAINQGKDVWVIPGSIYSEYSVGTNNLIKDGACVLTSIYDICKS